MTCWAVTPKFINAVVKKLTNLMLIFVVAGSIAAGMPMHSSGGESAMMDCCKKALEQNNSPHVAAARLCCAMNCNEPGSTSGNANQSLLQTGSEPSASIVLTLPSARVDQQLHAYSAAACSTHSQRTYILNLALLI